MEPWNEDIIKITEMMDEYISCEEILQHNIAKLKIKIDHLLR